MLVTIPMTNNETDRGESYQELLALYPLLSVKRGKIFYLNRIMMLIGNDSQ